MSAQMTVSNQDSSFSPNVLVPRGTRRGNRMRNRKEDLLPPFFFFFLPSLFLFGQIQFAGEAV